MSKRTPPQHLPTRLFGRTKYTQEYTLKHTCCMPYSVEFPGFYFTVPEHQLGTTKVGQVLHTLGSQTSEVPGTCFQDRLASVDGRESTKQEAQVTQRKQSDSHRSLPIVGYISNQDQGNSFGTNLAFYNDPWKEPIMAI